MNSVLTPKSVFEFFLLTYKKIFLFMHLQLIDESLIQFIHSISPSSSVSRSIHTIRLNMKVISW